jgi:putative zinc finger protein
MTCDETKLVLADYWSRTLSGDAEIALEAHLASCENCRLESHRLETLWRNLSLLPAEDPSPALRGRFYESLSAYRQGMESAPSRGLWNRITEWLPRNPAWQMAAGVALLAVGIGLGYGMRPGQPAAAPSELAELRSEVSSMRQLVALSLMQQQSAAERLRGVSWAYRVEPSDPEVLGALIQTVNHDPNVNVRLAAVDALHPFASNLTARQAVIQALARQDAPIVQVALIDLLVDLKEKQAASALHRVASDTATDAGVRQRAEWALERLQ